MHALLLLLMLGQYDPLAPPTPAGVDRTAVSSPPAVAERHIRQPEPQQSTVGGAVAHGTRSAPPRRVHVVMFTSPGCIPCRVQAARIKRWRGWKWGVHVVPVELTEAQAEAAGVVQTPTYALVGADGREIERVVEFDVRFFERFARMSKRK